MQDCLLGYVFHRLHHAREHLAVAFLAWRKSHAAVAEQCCSHTMPGDRRDRRFPASLGVEMCVEIDESRRDVESLGVDLFFAFASDLTDFNDRVPVDCDIRRKRFLASAVDDVAATYD